MKTIRLIRLNNIRIHAFHGAIPTENVVGADYIVNVEVKADWGDAAKNDNLTKTINYAEINGIVREEMHKQRILIETVAESIVDRIFQSFTQAEEAEVSVAKLNPPMTGQVESAEVIVKKVRN
ncbi:MAG: dihydroneopterin aldolase [Paludibacteraceae bacterium]|nr:dihydroneopterin aldolase [Paludibacteraceae bacterium]